MPVRQAPGQRAKSCADRLLRVQAKTRDCENGRGSIADRKVAYAQIKNSTDMLDFLSHLKGLERIPKKDRQFQTVVIDTLDAFQRSVKDEWMQKTKSPAFKGYDAWGFLEASLGSLMTRLLNLDYNVIVLVHFKHKNVKDGDNETRELVLQLQGDLANTIFDDFDLVGWLGTYWEAEEGQRIQKRGLTFETTPDRPFLKEPPLPCRADPDRRLSAGTQSGVGSRSPSSGGGALRSARGPSSTSGPRPRARHSWRTCSR